MDRLNIYLYMNTDPLLTLACTLALALSCAYTCGACAEISYKPSGRALQFSILCPSCRHRLHLCGTRSGTSGRAPLKAARRPRCTPAVMRAV